MGRDRTPAKRYATTHAALGVALLLTGATAFAQEAPRETRTFVVPPPSANSTGGAASASAPPPLTGAPRLRGKTLETRDVMHPEEVELVGLEQSNRPYRADLSLERTPLGQGAKGDVDDSDLHRRQLAIYSGERATRLPEVVRERGGAQGSSAPGDAPGRPPSMIWSVAAVVGLVVSLFLVHRKLQRVD